MDKIKKFDSIRTIKIIGIATAVIYLLSLLFYLFNIIVSGGSVFYIALPLIFMVLGIIMFLTPVRKIFFICLSVYIIYFLINLGLTVMIVGYEYIGQTIVEALWLVFLVSKYLKIKDIEVEKSDIDEYKNCLEAYKENDLFYFSVSKITGTSRWICTIYENYILIKRRYSFNLSLSNKKEFSFDFDNTSSNTLLGYISCNGKRNMCRMKKSEYDAYKKLIKKIK